MADVQNKGALFPEELIPELMNKTTGYSTLAALCKSTPIPFNGLKEFTFQLDKEIDVVAESGAKGKGGVTVSPVTIVPVKVEYGARISDEFMEAAEKEQIEILRAFTDGFARKLARGFDIMAFHGHNPRTGSASSVIGENHFDAKVTQEHKPADLTDPDGAVEEAIAIVQKKENEVNGLITDTTLKNALAKLKGSDGGKLYPELAWGNNPGVINGLAMQTTAGIGDETNHDHGLVGDFQNSFKWGYSKNIPMEIIQYGNPDNDTSLGDLKGHGQIYLRAEAYIGWGILNPDAFAWIRTTA